jgi:hypothetical protein
MLVPFVTICFAVLGLVASIAAHDNVYNYGNSYLNYTVVTGLFLQDDPSTNASTFNFMTTNFGLINRTYPTDDTCKGGRQATQWERFVYYVASLNREAPKNVEYKLFYMGRHGEGWHNAAESYYGTPAWNCYRSKRMGMAL